MTDLFGSEGPDFLELQEKMQMFGLLAKIIQHLQHLPLKEIFILTQRRRFQKERLSLESSSVELESE